MDRARGEEDEPGRRFEDGGGDSLQRQRQSSFFLLPLSPSSLRPVAHGGMQELGLTVGVDRVEARWGGATGEERGGGLVEEERADAELEEQERVRGQGRGATAGGGEEEGFPSGWGLETRGRSCATAIGVRDGAGGGYRRLDWPPSPPPRAPPWPSPLGFLRRLLTRPPRSAFSRRLLVLRHGVPLPSLARRRRSGTYLHAAVARSRRLLSAETCLSPRATGQREEGERKREKGEREEEGGLTCGTHMSGAAAGKLLLSIGGSPSAGGDTCLPLTSSPSPWGHGTARRWLAAAPSFLTGGEAMGKGGSLPYCTVDSNILWKL
uniref:Uncharacterized protein n=1 Tax=Oryza sativa subsp. japonica TaxID=39947 RepID=Q6Z424_ORYSJ|nr:hypothetical protein [Oryza sativa Japonica Group]